MTVFLAYRCLTIVNLNLKTSKVILLWPSRIKTSRPIRAIFVRPKLLQPSFSTSCVSIKTPPFALSKRDNGTLAGEVPVKNVLPSLFVDVYSTLWEANSSLCVDKSGSYKRCRPWRKAIKCIYISFYKTFGHCGRQFSHLGIFTISDIFAIYFHMWLTWVVTISHKKRKKKACLQ